MTRSHLIALSLALLPFAGCWKAGAPDPAVVSVMPGFGDQSMATPVTVGGTNLLRRVALNLDRPSRSTVADGFTLRLVGPGDLALTDVTWVDDTTVTGTVPAGGAAGVYALELVDPRGRTARLEGAFRVVDLSCTGEGTPCEDFNPCTRSERCTGGVCTGIPLTCNDGDPCTEDVCDPSRNGCLHPPSDGGTCTDDGLGCTADVCANGQCTHVADPSAGQCFIGGACVDAGVLEPSGACRACLPAQAAADWATAPAGVLCRAPVSECDVEESCDGVLDLCPADVLSDAGVACSDDGNLCTENACDGQGLCVHPAVAGGTPCNDLNGCTGPDTCTGTVCGGPSVCTANLPPLVSFTVTPRQGPPGTTFTFDPAATTDESPQAQLEQRWNFDWSAPGDTGFDTPWQPFGPTTHTFPDAGLYIVALEVRDPLLASDWVARAAVVEDATESAVITTLADENNSGATPAAPGGTGFSLREAIGWANSRPGLQALVISPALSGRIVLGSSLSSSSSSGIRIVGHPGVVIDGSNINGNNECLFLGGSGHLLSGLTFENCPGWALNANGGGWVRECTFRKGATGGGNGVLLGGSVYFGPHNEVSGFANTGILLTSNVTVDRCVVHGNGVGIRATTIANSADIWRTTLYGNSGTAIIASGANDIDLFHNVIVGNGGHGVEVSGNNADLLNNLITHNTGNGINAQGSTFGRQTNNLVFGNGGAACSSCTLGANSLTVDPLYANRAGFDFRLPPTSPARNAGIDVGQDLNGPLPGNFNGAAPDLGPWESP